MIAGLLIAATLSQCVPRVVQYECETDFVPISFPCGCDDRPWHVLPEPPLPEFDSFVPVRSNFDDRLAEPALVDGGGDLPGEPLHSDERNATAEVEQTSRSGPDNVTVVVIKLGKGELLSRFVIPRAFSDGALKDQLEGRPPRGPLFAGERLLTLFERERGVPGAAEQPLQFPVRQHHCLQRSVGARGDFAQALWRSVDSL